MNNLQKEIEVRQAIDQLRNYIKKKKSKIEKLQYKIQLLDEEILFLDDILMDQLYRYQLILEELQEIEENS
jgi:hypothetical protein